LLNDKRVTVFMMSVVNNKLLLTELPISGRPKYLIHYNYLAKQDVRITQYQCSTISKKLSKQTRLEIVCSTVPLIKFPRAFFAV
jgi:hypothetical protein